MNFFERQAAARRASFRLGLLFALAVTGIVLAVDFLVWLAFAAKDTAMPGQTAAALALASLLTLAAIGFGSLHRIAGLGDWRRRSLDRLRRGLGRGRSRGSSRGQGRRSNRGRRSRSHRS